MEVSNEKLTLLKSGSNSQIHRYGSGEVTLAIKSVPSSCTKELKHLENEYEILRGVSHPHIIEVFKYKAGVTLSHLDIETQYTRVRVCLERKSPRVLQEAEAKCSSAQKLIPSTLLCSPVFALDIKLENLLVFNSKAQQPKLKLADFGFAESISSNGEIKLFNSFKGTRRGYISPQIYQTLSDSSKFYDARSSDIFAMGVLLFSLVMGRLPFEFADSQNKLYGLIRQKKYAEFWASHQHALARLELEQGSMLSEFKELFQQMVAFDCEERPIIDQVMDHPWMQGSMETLQV